MQEIFVVLPTFNEGTSLVSLLQELEEVLAAPSCHILVVDDGSTDTSLQTLRALNLPHVQIVTHDQNRGLGEAIRTGLTVALQQCRNEHDIIVIMDSDMTHTPYLIARMVNLVQEGNDVVIASRFRYGSRVKGLSPYRVFLSHAASWVFRLFLPIPGVKDYTCGYRAYRASLLKQSFAKYHDDFVSESGFSCMVDILLKLAPMDAIIVEVPLILRYERKVSASKMKIFQTIFASLKLLVRTRFNWSAKTP
jgi:dolichol-phosphate mannosyltransferase